MNVAELNKIITFQNNIKTPGDMFNADVAWQDIFTAYASIKPVTAKEQIQNNTVDMVTTHVIKMWYRKNINSEMRIKYENRFFNIISIINVKEENKELNFMCEETSDA